LPNNSLPCNIDRKRFPLGEFLRRQRKASFRDLALFRRRRQETTQVSFVVVDEANGVEGGLFQGSTPMNDRISRLWIAAIEKQTQEVKTSPRVAAYNRRRRMSEFRKRCSFSFTIGLALCLACLTYIWQWQNFAPRIEGSLKHAPYLTPWTVLSVAVLSLSLAIITFPVRRESPIQTIIAKTLGIVVLCFATIFLLEYFSGIHMPDLDVFLLPDAADHHDTLYAARPCAQSALTSLFFALALLFYDRNPRWRLRTFQIGILAALALPSFASLGYIAQFFFATWQPSWLVVGLSLPSVILYFTLAWGFLGLSFPPSQSRPTVARTGRISRAGSGLQKSIATHSKELIAASPQKSRVSRNGALIAG
jgi:hypothetical protein